MRNATRRASFEASKVWLAAGALLLLAPARPGAAQARRTPIVIELFTSEGCSSCPPADRFLARLEKEQPLHDLEIIPLEQHVDYWDRLGWRDPFSSAEFTLRQQRYAQWFRLEGPYTPEMVVDGQAEFVGSDARRAGVVIARAAQAPKGTVELAVNPGAKPGAEKLAVRVENLPPGAARDTADVLLAITEDDLSSNVARGENAGRQLVHSAVVRRLSVIGQAKRQQTPAFAAQPAITIERGWKPENLRAVVLVQERDDRKMLGAASISLAASAR
ncbi:MAG TPA: DUF1223 domain-containing protein [Bryobacterales bacterium]|nr:DUF1223 domain-containing protein [Bryobacterales bacterium]